MREPIVVLGEVHDNVAQHALRAQALARVIERGRRPAIALEQLDHDRQPEVERVRQEPGDTASRVTHLIEAAGGRGWNWDLYRPYLALALENNLPIVAANLSRKQAMNVAREGLGSVFEESQRVALGLDAISPDLLLAQEHEIEQGHCGRAPPEALPDLALAQIARDAMLAQSIAPYFDQGVVLLTGNGHARRDIGVLQHVSAADAARAISIGLLEDDKQAAEQAPYFDVAMTTPAQARADPCAKLAPMRMSAPPADAPRPLRRTLLPLPANPQSLDGIEQQRKPD
ncbi:MAG TPA: ChaN family lipoprotein [Burkholderiaceae bacterium]|nr:ChaN family lipoprotein [Burkholderiaceae bacterium]